MGEIPENISQVLKESGSAVIMYVVRFFLSFCDVGNKLFLFFVKNFSNETSTCIYSVYGGV